MNQNGGGSQPAENDLENQVLEAVKTGSNSPSIEEVFTAAKKNGLPYSAYLDKAWKAWLKEKKPEKRSK